MDGTFVRRAQRRLRVGYQEATRRDRRIPSPYGPAIHQDALELLRVGAATQLDSRVHESCDIAAAIVAPLGIESEELRERRAAPAQCRRVTAHFGEPRIAADQPE